MVSKWLESKELGPLTSRRRRRRGGQLRTARGEGGRKGSCARKDECKTSKRHRNEQSKQSLPSELEGEKDEAYGSTE